MNKWLFSSVIFCFVHFTTSLSMLWASILIGKILFSIVKSFAVSCPFFFFHVHLLTFIFVCYFSVMVVVTLKMSLDGICEEVVMQLDCIGLMKLCIIYVLRFSRLF